MTIMHMAMARATMGLRCAVVGIVAGSLGCGSLNAQERTPEVSPFPKLDATKTQEAVTTLARIETKYGSCSTYRDHGITIDALDSSFGSSVGRFDTLFVRNRGLRFRYFDESGALLYGIWSRGDQTTEWERGATRSPAAPVANEMASLKGVTAFASWVVFKLLTQLPPVSPGPSCGPWYSDNPSCARCANVVFRCSPQGFTSAYMLDSRADVVRRFYFWDAANSSDGGDPLVAELPSATPSRTEHRRTDSPKTETAIMYDSIEFDGDEIALAAELDRKPW